MTGVWEYQFTPQPALVGGDPYFVILHLTGMDLPNTSKVQVELGYGTDEFTVHSGTDVWTRPIDPSLGPIVVRYIGPGPTGGVSLGEYGSGEEWATTYVDTPYLNSVSRSDIFFHTDPYVEPDYMPWLQCGMSFNWQNAACAPPGVIRDTSTAVCMLIMAHDHDGQHLLSTCSGTLIDTNLVLTARHCATDPNGEDILSGSVVFGFQTDCPGAKPNPYNPVFCKIRRAVAAGGTPDDFGSIPDHDWLIVEIDPVPVGITPRSLRNTAPVVNEPIFALHHPNGAAKKLQQGTLASGDVWNVQSFDYAGGSSGSALFDASGNIIGAALARPASGYYQCTEGYTSALAVLDQLANPTVPTTPFDIMLVIDRSGSMSDIGVSGDTKLNEARDAASLFVQLVRLNAGDRMGLVSFATSATLGEALANFNNGQRHALVGNAPYTGGAVGGLSASGSTSIGNGIQEAMGQLNPPGSNTRAILLMTDGMENTPPMVADVEGQLGDTRLFAIGFGTDDQIDSQLLSRVTADHSGIYTRAQDGLDLKKFFGLCFGNIFVSGALADPYFTLPARTREGKEMRFDVCDEDQLIVIVGWERAEDILEVEVKTPGGVVLTTGSKRVVSDTGNTWTFLRVPLPYYGERSGTWRARVRRSKESKGQASVRYFITVLADGGPVMRALPQPQPLYTGDRIVPTVTLAYRNGAAVAGKVRVHVEAPAASLGELVARKGVKKMKLEGDHPNAFALAASRLPKRRGGPVSTMEKTIELYDDGVHEDGGMEPDGIYANPVETLLRYEGTYMFHAVAEYGHGCRGRREALWSVHVEAGIDGGRTTARFKGKPKRGAKAVAGQVTLVPRDTYGTLFGPLRANRFKVTGASGTRVTGAARDGGDGSYIIPLEWPVDSKPLLVVSQPGRDPVVISADTPRARRSSTKRRR